MADVSLGIDIGGTKIAAGLVTRDGTLLEQETYSTPTDSKEAIISLLKEIIVDFTKKEHHIIGVGIGSAGQVHYQKGQILSGTTNLTDWNNIPIVAELQDVTTAPIFLDNDANAFALAEYVFGEAKGTKDLIGLTLGTGVGGGVISDGKLLHGSWGGAGELGHLTVNMHGPLCNCGARGCLEVYASGTGIAKRMMELLGEPITSKEVFALYDAGDPLGTEVIETAIEALSFGMISLMHVFNPTVIVLGGGIAQNQPWLADRIQAIISGNGIGSLIEPVKILTSNLGENAGVIGAASQAWYKN